MTSDAFLGGLVLLTILVTWFLIRSRENAVQRYFFEPIENGRTVLGAVLLVAGVITALQSGVAWMMVLGLLGIAFAVAFVYYEEPHKEIR